MVLRQGYVMSPGLFNVFFNRTVRQVNERPAGRETKVKDKDGSG